MPPEALAELHAPIGLPIGAETPEEIAVSIAAEMIGVRNAAAPAEACARVAPFERSRSRVRPSE